jgi:hypothetical protein
LDLSVRVLTELVVAVGKELLVEFKLASSNWKIRRSRAALSADPALAWSKSNIRRGLLLKKLWNIAEFTFF